MILIDKRVYIETLSLLADDSSKVEIVVGPRAHIYLLYLFVPELYVDGHISRSMEYKHNNTCASAPFKFVTSLKASNAVHVTYVITAQTHQRLDKRRMLIEDELNRIDNHLPRATLHVNCNESKNSLLQNETKVLSSFA